MSRLRAYIFSLIFYINLMVFMIAYLPLFLGPRKWVVAGAKLWSRSSMWWHRVIVGTKVEFRHTERIPKGPVLVASKHQSAWETFALLTQFDDPVFVLKRELMMIPFFGWYLRKLEMIPIDRGDGVKALRKMIVRARIEAARGRQIIIFPEGTRTAPGVKSSYRGGIALVYQLLGLPCLPVALNSGWFWPRRKLDRHRGTIIVEYLEPIPDGLDKQDFRGRLERAIETASKRLADETANMPEGPPIPAAYRAPAAKTSRH